MPFQNPDDSKAMEKRSLASHQSNDEPSKTVQGPAIEADTNWIARTYGLVPGGRMPVPAEVFDPRYYQDQGEAPPDLQAALHLVMDAEHNFSQLPAGLRARFNHSPAFLWDFLQDERNYPEAVKLGLLVDRSPERTPEASSETLPPA